ncbi:MAG: hypothetical protein ACE5OZ_03360 [Candidatus Heimdallarchaeota archaeon]
MAQKRIDSHLTDLADMRETVNVAQEQLSQSLVNIIKHLQKLSKSGILAQDKSEVEKTISKIISDEFKIISTFLTQALWNSIEATIEENERLSSTILKLRPELLETETERDRLTKAAYDLEQDKTRLEEKLKLMAESVKGFLATIQALNNVKKEHETTRARLNMVLEAATNESVPQQVERLINLLLKAGYKVQEAQKRGSKFEEESFRLRKTHEAVSLLSEHDSTSRMIIVLAEMGEIEIDKLAEITGQKKIVLKYQLKKWANRGLVKLSKDGLVVSLE